MMTYAYSGIRCTYGKVAVLLILTRFIVMSRRLETKSTVTRRDAHPVDRTQVHTSFHFLTCMARSGVTGH
jgi:hypothetical protein